MKNTNGFSIPEAIILIVLMGVVFIGATVKLSHGFQDNSEEIYEVEIESILNRAVAYGDRNLELFEDGEKYTLTVRELIREGYLLADVDDDYSDPRDINKNLNDLKITLEYKDENVEASLAN